MERIQDLLVRHNQTARVLGLLLALIALGLAGSAGDPWPGG